jgi:L-lactate dehydrogenase complex protein LldG
MTDARHEVSRHEILGAIRTRLGRADWGAERIAAARARIESRLSGPVPGPIPARARIGAERLPILFRDMAERAKASVAKISGIDALPAAIEDYLAAEGLGRALCVAGDPELEGVAGEVSRGLSIRRGRPDPADKVGLTSAFAGIAETGSLMLVSSAAHPVTLDLLVETLVVVLREDRIVGCYEEGFSMLRRALGAKPWPRTVMLVTGPSRSADIEQKIQYGAHGPRRLHVLLVGSSGAAEEAPA